MKKLIILLLFIPFSVFSSPDSYLETMDGRKVELPKWEVDKITGDRILLFCNGENERLMSIHANLIADAGIWVVESYHDGSNFFDPKARINVNKAGIYKFHEWHLFKDKDYIIQEK